MLDISFSELLLCFVVALVVLGPERLPAIARGIGRWTGQAKAYMRNLSAELERESSVAELKAQIGDARRILNEESVAMKRSFDETAAEGRAIVGEARQAVADTQSGSHPGSHPGLHPSPLPDVPHEGLRPPAAPEAPSMAPMEASPPPPPSPPDRSA